MKNVIDIQKKIQKMIVPMISSLIIVYFFVYGMRSLQDKANLQQEISVLEQDYNLVHERRVAIESHVGLLKPEHVNPDYLDEKSREILGLMHLDEVVIYSK